MTFRHFIDLLNQLRKYHPDLHIITVRGSQAHLLDKKRHPITISLDHVTWDVDLLHTFPHNQATPSYLTALFDTYPSLPLIFPQPATLRWHPSGWYISNT